MQIVIHRVNTAEELRKVPAHFGVEIDVRGHGSELRLSHDVLHKPERAELFSEYLEGYAHRLLVVNVKEAGYEDEIIRLLAEKNVSEYFLLDVEFPFLYRATRKNMFRKIAVRYSEAEPIEGVRAQIENGTPLLDWVWIDTNTHLPLNPEVWKTLSQFRTCLVCPDRWGRPQDIEPYSNFMQKSGITPDAVMTSTACAPLWSKFAQL